MRIETLILKSLLFNEAYCRSVLPYLKSEYFEDYIEKILFSHIVTFINTYNERPTIEALGVILNDSSLKEDDVKVVLETIKNFSEPEENKLEWLYDKTEKFCQDKAIHNAVLESIHIISDKKEKKDKGSIPDLLKDALSVSFDPKIGHDYLSDAEDRYDFYHRKEERIPFDIEQFNKITNGGIPRKTLNVILAGTNVGKTLAMCHFATYDIILGKNVLYITLEMGEEKIAERIDANFLDISLENLNLISKTQYINLLEKARAKTTGKLFIKEYPTVSANVNHFRHLLNELKLKKKFIPDIIYVDYINICASSRLKYSPNVNSYMMIKSIAEELRGLAVEYNVPIFTATQTNRDGFDSSDPGLTNTAESFGLPATADFVFALISSEELEKLSQFVVKQLKSRYGDVSKMKKFFVGVDKTKMRLYEIKNTSTTQNTITSSDEDDEETEPTKNKFSSFNY